MNDLIFVSMEDWDDIWRRNQFVCAAFSRRFPDRQILFVSPPRNVSYLLRSGNLKGLRQSATETVPELPRITVTRPLKLMPNTLRAGRLFNEAMMRRHIASEARRLGLRDPILWLNPHSAVHMAGRMRERGVVYDITDDWISLTQSPAVARLTEEQDRALCARADAVIVCSSHLYAIKKDLARNLHLIPNGVDLSHYDHIADRRGEVVPAAGKWKRPVLGYTGTIHPDRVDIALVEALAKRMPEASIVLVGPNHLSPGQMKPLSALSNLYFIGPVPYKEIPQYMRAFDVCITPHLVTPFTESLNPIKLWEYLAAGLPIVSTDVAGFRDFPKLVRIANGPEEFESELRAALCEEPSLIEARRREAAKHSWDSRLEDIVKVLEQIGDARNG
jgi:glycosyltransferase involved in cell wall biosynthesis